MTDQVPPRLPVTRRAVIQRCNRRLKKYGQLLLARRGHADQCKTGKYYLVSVAEGRLIERDVDLEKLARREGALELWETLEPKGVSSDEPA